MWELNILFKKALGKNASNYSKFIFQYPDLENLDMFGLINMLSEGMGLNVTAGGAKSRKQSEAGNGRMYDPVLGRFAGVDPVIQSPDYSVNYNGYTYCFNNPLKYTDPTGYSAYGEYIHNMIFGDNSRLDAMWREKFGEQYDDAFLGGSSSLSEIDDQTKLNIDKAIEWLNRNAYDNYDKVPLKSDGKTPNFRCATWIVNALCEGGGAKYRVTAVHAKDFGPTLIDMGFQTVDVSSGDYVKGDVVIIQPPSGRTSGHIEMWSGTQWISDWKQGNNFWPGDAYKKEKPNFTVYRYIIQP